MNMQPEQQGNTAPFGVGDLIEELRAHQQMLLPFTRFHLDPNHLDIGCGNGMTSVFHQEELGGTPTLCDVADIRHEQAKLLPFELIADGHLPFEDGTFDAAYFQYVLHHVPEDQLPPLVAEAARVAPRIVIVEELIGDSTDPDAARDFDERMNAAIHPDVVMPVHRYYTSDELVSLLHGAGLGVFHKAMISPGDADNGFLETHLFVAERGSL